MIQLHQLRHAGAFGGSFDIKAVGLKELGIEVRFEKEHINSLSGDGEVMLTLLASFAQEETRSISENEKWSVKKRFEQGIPVGKPKILGYRWEGDTMVVVPEEAEVVRRIYQNFLDGKSRLETERELAAEGITSINGKRLCDSQLKCILSNISYTGNMLFQKEYIADPISKQRKKNHGELPQYFVENSHEAIIPMETWQYVQDEMARRRELGCFANKALTLNCFSTKIKCGKCGRSFVRSTRKNRAKSSQLGEHYTFWCCTSKKKTNCPSCKNGTIREDILKEECAKVLGIPEFDEEVFTEKVTQITLPKSGTMIFDFTDGTQLTHHWSRNSKKECWTEERRREWGELHKKKSTNPNRSHFNEFTGFIKCGNCGENYRSQSGTYVDGTKERHWRCCRSCGNTAIKDSTMKGLVCDVLGIEEFSESEMDAVMEKAEVANSTVTFHFKDGHTESRDYKDKRKGTPHTEEYKEQMRQMMKERWTPERRQEMGERIRALRKERGKAWGKGK